MTLIKEQGESIKKQKRNNTESGRSMVEMLGVLAIMGVLSVGSIAGYQYAMNKYRANTLINDLSRRAAVVSFLIGRIPVVQASGMRRRSFVENTVFGIKMMSLYPKICPFMIPCWRMADKS